jgi:hypothetical protein
VESWIQKSDPSVVVLYLPKPTQRNPFPQVRAVGKYQLAQGKVIKALITA